MSWIETGSMIVGFVDFSVVVSLLVSSFFSVSSLTSQIVVVVTVSVGSVLLVARVTD